MNIKIRNVDYVYGTDDQVNNVNIRFDSSEYGFNLNGFVSLTLEEYNSSATDLAGLANIVKGKLQAKFNE
ncbi:hypothetical protein [Bacillus smithii]|uniref:hypothetical protein n=1 Tax=Bacillus smithii TaxID=1479 RepID=UPI002E2499A5|nr:hypothetical protein [Bacillus smithii]MED4928958.1 hypothetical protein [Bacillus smithii]